MKRTVPLMMLLGAAGLLVSVLGVAGETPCPSCCKARGKFASGCADEPEAVWSKPCSSRSCCASVTANKDNVIDELAAILNDTKSPETFLITTMVLGRLGTEAKGALPIIIRNAERLELFDDLYSVRGGASAGNRDLATREIITALESILDKKGTLRGRIRATQQTHVYSYQSPTPYPSSSCQMYPPPPPAGTTFKPASAADGGIKPVPAGTSAPD